MNKGLISIIVPVYKSEQYLDRCINSILKQTYSFFEVIIVMDGEDDACRRICESHAKEDDRIGVYVTEHQGVSAARNYGMRVMHGEYVVFVDSDDYLHEEYLNILLENMLQYDALISCCGFTREEHCFNTKDRTTFCVEGNKAISYCRLKRQDVPFYHDSIWNKMFRVSFLCDTDLFDPSFPLGEDAKFLFPIVLRANRVVFDSSVLYFYRKPNENDKKAYATYTNYYKYDRWEYSFLRKKKADHDLVQKARQRMEVNYIFLLYQDYFEGKKDVRWKMRKHWDLIEKHIIRNNAHPFWGRKKLMLVSYMIRMGIDSRFVSFLYHLH